MTTIPEMVNDVRSLMHAWTGVTEQTTYLNQPVDAVSTTLSVEHGTRVTAGLIEIDDELMHVASGEDAGTVQLLPDGRGEQGSTAVAHLLNARVSNDPYFPRVGIRKAIQSVLEDIRPELFRVKTTTIQWSPSRIGYELPSDVDRVLEVKYEVPGPWKTWPLVSCWRFVKSAPTTDFPSGKSLEIGSAGVVSGYDMHVTYAAPYGSVVTGQESFADLGIQESLYDVLLYGAAWRLTQSAEVVRLLIKGVVQKAQQESTPPGAATNLTKQFFALYRERVADERRRLLELHPMQVHRTW